MKKAIVLDLDGTFLTDDYKITSLNKKAVKRAMELGWDIIISTGKSFSRSRKFYDALGLNTWFINSHGKLISKPNQSEFEFMWMEKDDVNEVIIEHADKMENFLIETYNKIYAKDPEAYLIKKFMPSTKVLKYEPGQELDKIIGVYAQIKPGETINTTKLKAHPWDLGEGHHIHYFKSKKTSKWKGVEKVLKKEKYDFVVAFGNGRSDIEILKNVDMGIAMKGSHSKVLDVIFRISEFDNNESGVGHEILKLIKETS